MGYCTPNDVRTRGKLTDPPYTDVYVQNWVDLVTNFIETVTGQWFSPRDFSPLKLDGRETRTLLLPVPVISITKIEFVDWPTVPAGISEMDLDAFVIYNRHVESGLTHPDDRANPRIAFLSPRVPGERLVTFEDFFPRGKLNIHLTGKFGYTEADQAADRLIATDVGDAITAPDVIKMVNGNFTQEDVGRTITIAGSASNNGAYKIKTVVGPTDVQVEEQTLTTEGAGFTADVSAFPQWGITPPLIKEVCIRLVLRDMADPAVGSSGAPDGFQYEARMRAEGRVTQEKVRDQSISYAAPSSAGDGNLTGLITGDPQIDMILMRYKRPPVFASA